MIEDFIRKREKRAKLYNSFGHKLYYSILKNVDCMIGNSSSGLTEAPYLGLTTINIGNRQEGRVQFGNIINVSAKSIIIERKIRLALYKKKTNNKNNLKKGATKKVVKIIEKFNFSSYLKKSFYDLNWNEYRCTYTS